MKFAIKTIAATILAAHALSAAAYEETFKVEFTSNYFNGLAVQCQTPDADHQSNASQPRVVFNVESHGGIAHLSFFSPGMTTSTPVLHFTLKTAVVTPGDEFALLDPRAQAKYSAIVAQPIFIASNIDDAAQPQSMTLVFVKSKAIFPNASTQYFDSIHKFFRDLKLGNTSALYYKNDSSYDYSVEQQFYIPLVCQ